MATSEVTEQTYSAAFCYCLSASGTNKKNDYQMQLFTIVCAQKFINKYLYRQCRFDLMQTLIQFAFSVMWLYFVRCLYCLSLSTGAQYIDFKIILSLYAYNYTPEVALQSCLQTFVRSFVEKSNPTNERTNLHERFVYLFVRQLICLFRR